MGTNKIYSKMLLRLLLVASCVLITLAKTDDWCEFGNAIDLSGAELNREYINVGPIPLERSFSIEAWIWNANPRQATWHPIASRTSAYWQFDTAVPNVYSDFNFQVDDYARLSFFMGNGQTAPWQYGILLLSNTKVRTKTWQHVAVTVSSSGGNPREAKIYLDGVVVDTDVWGEGQRNYLQDAPVTVGRYDNTDRDAQWWPGFLDEIRFFNGVRTAQQIDASMFLTRVQDDALLVYFTFDDYKEPNNASVILNRGALAASSLSNGLVQFSGPIGPVYYVESRICSDDHLRPDPFRK